MRDQKQKKVLEHLKKNGSITSLEAFELYRATRLSSIIYRLKTSYDITTLMINEENGSAPYARYFFKGVKENG